MEELTEEEKAKIAKIEAEHAARAGDGEAAKNEAPPPAGPDGPAGTPDKPKDESPGIHPPPEEAPPGMVDLSGPLPQSPDPAEAARDALRERQRSEWIAFEEKAEREWNALRDQQMAEKRAIEVKNVHEALADARHPAHDEAHAALARGEFSLVARGNVALGFERGAKPGEVLPALSREDVLSLLKQQAVDVRVSLRTE